MTALETLAEHRCFGGVQGYYRHESRECGSPMRFSVYRPPAAESGSVPVLYYLAGLTCTEETFAIKAGAQRVAAELGLMLVAPDTSPRIPRLPGDDSAWDFGLGAGFYVDATHRTLVASLPHVLLRDARAAADRGRELSGTGPAPRAFSVTRWAVTARWSARCVIQAATGRCPRSRRSPHRRVARGASKAFSGYLGDDRKAWAEYDASELIARQAFPGRILVDQGTADPFLGEQLQPDAFEAAAREAGQDLELRRHPGYDHGYFFIASFVEDHLRHHAAALHAA